MNNWCSDLAALLDAEGFAKAVLVGHCLGANLALQFAGRHPARTAGLVLIEPMPPEALGGALCRLPRFKPLLQFVILLIRALNALGLHRRALAPQNLEQMDREMRAALARGPEGQAALAKYASPLADLRTTATGAYLQAVLAMTEALPRLEQIAAPVLVLLAEQSSFAEQATTRRVLARLADCEIVQLPAQHWVPTEQPEAMRAAIERWVRRCEGTAGRD